jgi:chaperone modulatory protein CbpM
MTERVQFPIVVLPMPERLDLETFAARGGVHPELVRRFVALGLLEPSPGPAREPWFAPDQLAALGRIRRLHAGLPLNYAALGLVMDLLDRIARLETTLRTRPAPRSTPPWT